VLWPGGLSAVRPILWVAIRKRVDRSNQVRRYARHEPDRPAQPQRFLQPRTRIVQLARGVFRDAQVAKRVGQRQLVADLHGKRAGLFKDGNRGVVVMPDNLVGTADPEQGVRFRSPGACGSRSVMR
jgi:hypothetical protein